MDVAAAATLLVLGVPLLALLFTLLVIYKGGALKRLHVKFGRLSVQADYETPVSKSRQDKALPKGKKRAP
jgi:hypothetical protein